jgi:hypothetical protein
MYLQWGCLGRFFKARLLINTKADHLSQTPLTPFGDQPPPADVDRIPSHPSPINTAMSVLLPANDPISQAVWIDF